MLSDADAMKYGTALANCLRHFPVQTTQKALDFAMLMFAAVQFELPRIGMSIQLARRGAAQAQAQRQPGGGLGATVMQFRQPHGPPHPTPPNGAGGSEASPPIADPPADDGMGGDTPFH